jgi:hypothetical protein
MPRLSGPPHDLEKMTSALTHADFGLFLPDNVEVRRNLNASELSDALYQATEQAGPDEVLLIYYSGHGERLGLGQNLGLVGVDVPYDKRKNRALDTAQLSGWLDQTRARSKILILDCCYSGQYRGLVDEEVLNSFGQGTLVLSSGGNQVVQDQVEDDGPSPFTGALAEVLLDERLPGSSGWLTADDVYDALVRHDPRLVPEPKRTMSAQGQFGLAKRPTPDRERTEVQGWPADLTVVRVSVTVAEDHVVAEWDRDGNGRLTSDERDVAALETSRLGAVRRLCELADAVMRAKDYNTPDWQMRARRALDTAGANLFEAALPTSLQNQLVRLDLRFEGRWGRLSEFPWEYLNVPQGPAEEMRRAILVSRSPASADGGSRPGLDVTEVALVNTLGSPQDRLAIRVGEEMEMAGAHALAMFTQQPAEWHQFLEAVDQRPRCLVLCAPVRRERMADRLVTKVGFARGDLRPTDSLVTELGRVGGMSAVILVTVTTDEGGDAIRAAPMAAAELSAGLHVPVVFVCHSPGLEKYMGGQLPREPRTFVGILLTALARGKPLDESLWFARERVLRFIPAEMLPTFGAPGFFEGAAPAARLGQPVVGHGGRSMARPGRPT